MPYAEVLSKSSHNICMFSIFWHTFIYATEMLSIGGVLAKEFTWETCIFLFFFLAYSCSLSLFTLPLKMTNKGQVSLVLDSQLVMINLLKLYLRNIWLKPIDFLKVMHTPFYFWSWGKLVQPMLIRWTGLYMCLLIWLTVISNSENPR